MGLGGGPEKKPCILYFIARGWIFSLPTGKTSTQVLLNPGKSHCAASSAIHFLAPSLLLLLIAPYCSFSCSFLFSSSFSLSSRSCNTRRRYWTSWASSSRQTPGPRRWEKASHLIRWEWLSNLRQSLHIAPPFLYSPIPCNFQLFWSF